MDIILQVFAMIAYASLIILWALMPPAPTARTPAPSVSDGPSARERNGQVRAGAHSTPAAPLTGVGGRRAS